MREATMFVILGAAYLSGLAAIAPASAAPPESAPTLQYYIEATVVRVRASHGEGDAALGPLQRLEAPLAGYLLPSALTGTDEALPFLRFALEALGETLDVEVVAVTRFVWPRSGARYRDANLVRLPRWSPERAPAGESAEVSLTR